MYRKIKKIIGFRNEAGAREKSRGLTFFTQSPNVSSQGLARHYYNNEELEQLNIDQMLNESVQKE